MELARLFDLTLSQIFVTENQKLVDHVASCVGEDAKIFRKTLLKAQKIVDQLGTLMHNAGEKLEHNGSRTLGGSLQCGNQHVFGRRLEDLALVRASFAVQGRITELSIPSFVRDLGEKLLAHRGVQGLFRVSANYRRCSECMEALDAGTSLSAFAAVTPHDAAHLLKEWTRELPGSLIPDCLISLFVRLFGDQGSPSLSEAKAGITLAFLGKFISLPARDVIVYLSHVLNSVSQFSSSNGMTSRNLALVCPSLFTGAQSQAKTGGRQFEAVINMMEFLIDNPQVFVLSRGKLFPKDIDFHRSARPQSPAAVHVLDGSRRAVPFSAPFIPLSPKNRRLIFDFRTPAQQIRSMGKAAVSSMKGKFGRVKSNSSSRSSPSSSTKPAEKAPAFDRLLTSDLAEVCRLQVPIPCPHEPPMSATPPSSTRSRRRSGSASSQKRVADLMDISHSSLELCSPIKKLDFAEEVPIEHCACCSARSPFGMLEKPATSEIGIQVDTDALMEESLPTSPSPPLECIGLRNDLPADWRMKTRLMERSRPSVSEIPSGIVKTRLQFLAP